jgi:hypothetical protein
MAGGGDRSIRRTEISKKKAAAAGLQEDENGLGF